MTTTRPFPAPSDALSEVLAPSATAESAAAGFDVLPRDQIEDQICSTCQILDVADVADRIRWTWNRRLTRAIARAHFLEWKIELSSRLFPLLPQLEQRDTVIHEVCHLVAHHLHGPSILHHGREWKELMVRAGGEPRARSKSIDGADLLQGRNRMPYYCACRTHAVTPYRARKIDLGFVFVCTRCRSELSSRPPLADAVSTSSRGARSDPA